MADWQRQGYSAGLDGEHDVTTAYNKRAEVCAKHGQIVDKQEFELGHAEGIERFCEIPNAVNLGERGAHNVIRDQTCPEQDYIGFQSAFNAGYRLYQLRGEASQAQQEFDRLQSRQFRYYRNIDQLQKQLSSADASNQQKQNAAVQIRRIRRDLYSLRSSMRYYRNQAISRKQAADSYASLLDLEYGEDR